MILIDTSAIVHGQIALEIKRNKTDRSIFMDKGNMRHMLLNQLRSINMRFRDKFGRLILVRDSSDCWRLETFPEYKWKRKQKRLNDVTIDWNAINGIVDSLFDEFALHIPFRQIKVDRCEADDVIAFLARNAKEPTVIVSGDNDFLQLQVNPFVKQYAPAKDEFLVEKDPLGSLKDLLMEGDDDDGVPNCLSNIKCFKDGVRQTALTQMIRASIAPEIDVKKDGTVSYGSVSPSVLERLKFNSTMVNLLVDIPIPKVQANLANANQELTESFSPRLPLFMYFSQNQCRQLMEKVSDFSIVDLADSKRLENMLS